MKLSKAQQFAANKLTREPQSAYDLQVSLTTLRACVRLGVARDVTPHGPGGMFSPRTHFKFVKAGA